MFLSAQFVRARPVVPVDMAYIFAKCRPMHGKVVPHRPDITFVVYRLDDVRIRLLEMPNDRPGSVSGAVFSNDHFEIEVSLLVDQSLQALANISFLVVGHHADRHRGS
jgi:hypothetical protein